jgi:hypothetical protein
LATSFALSAAESTAPAILSGDKRLQREGETEQAEGKVKGRLRR